MQCVEKYSLFRLLRQIDERNLKSRLKFVLSNYKAKRENYGILLSSFSSCNFYKKLCETNFILQYNTYIDFTKYFIHSTSVEK